MNDPEPPCLDLLRAYGAAVERLRARGIVRTKNVIGDYAEHLFAKTYGWTLEPSSNRAFDAKHDGVRYQIKCRHITARNPSRQVGDLPEDNEIGFDVLAAALFAEDYTVLRAAMIPVHTLLPLRTRVSGRLRFILRDTVWDQPGVRDVTDELRETQARD